MTTECVVLLSNCVCYYVTVFGAEVNGWGGGGSEPAAHVPNVKVPRRARGPRVGGPGRGSTCKQERRIVLRVEELARGRAAACWRIDKIRVRAPERRRRHGNAPVSPPARRRPSASRRLHKQRC
ncbi:hypothetical protein EVAR_41026_1 [Eumeta japonica]|uniref:Uncharacterized protein n=1 Tax=Eumeta variegata TaxID=151549 RepID=A0A4C1Z0H7_EUMVA|nr:hypothetical protein EVAR_41026_1 [Eumeta japonica]